MRLTTLYLVILAFAAASTAGAQQKAPDGKKTLAATLGVYVFPTAGQNAEVQSREEAQCYSWAAENTGIDPFQVEKQRAAGQQQAAAQAAGASRAGEGAGARGAVGGAAVGALVGEIASNDAGKGAAIGGATGLIVGRAKRRQAQKAAADSAANTAAVVEAVSDDQMTSFRKAFSVCLEAKRYLVKF
jgi:hypothetical protein